MKRRTSSARTYSDRTLKILWGRAAGRCAVPDCRIELFADATDHDPIVVIGDIAHIEAASDRGPRACATKDKRKRDEYENLILLCKNCHARLDGQKNTNTVAAIRALKADHEAWVRESLPERGMGKLGWTVVVLCGEHPIDAKRCAEALSPDYPMGGPIVLKASTADGDWGTVYRELGKGVGDLLNQSDPFDCRFAVFPLAPISACIAFGFLLTSRPRVRLFQYHRDAQSWEWRRSSGKLDDVSVAGLPKRRVKSDTDVAICFELSAAIAGDQIRSAIGKPTRIVRLRVSRPRTSWLRSPTQLDRLGTVTRGVFESLTALCPNARRWHVFYAGPAPGAVRVGQQINPTMSPLVCLYEFRARRRSPYQRSICLGGSCDE